MTPALDFLLPDVLSAGRGDRDAFARLVTATSRLVASITLAETRDLEASRDAAQEAFLHAWRDLPRLKNPASFLPWLRELARRRARESGTRGRTTGGASAEAALATAVDPAPLADSGLVDLEGRRALSEALAALPDEAREVVLLYYREGRSAAQVAGLLELSEAAVWQRLSRARARLRQDLLERAGEVAAATAPGPAFTALVVAALGSASPGAAAAATVASTGVGIGSGMAFGAVGAAWLAGSLGLAFQTRVLLARAADDPERVALRRFARANQVTLAGVGLAALAAWSWGPRWLFAAAFAVLPLVDLVVRKALMPEATVAWIRAEKGGSAALAFMNVLDVVVAAALVGLAWWVRQRLGG